jgi:hypothetical protein
MAKRNCRHGKTTNVQEFNKNQVIAPAQNSPYKPPEVVVHITGQEIAAIFEIAYKCTIEKQSLSQAGYNLLMDVGTRNGWLKREKPPEEIAWEARINQQTEALMSEIALGEHIPETAKPEYIRERLKVLSRVGDNIVPVSEVMA